MEEWLTQRGLAQYAPKSIADGYDVADIKSLADPDSQIIQWARDCDMKPGHEAKLMICCKTNWLPGAPAAGSELKEMGDFLYKCKLDKYLQTSLEQGYDEVTLIALMSRTQVEQWAAAAGMPGGFRVRLIAGWQTLVRASGGFVLSPGKYTLQKKLGKGDFGEVYLVKSGKDQLSALKLIRASTTDDRNRAMREVVAMFQLPESPHTVKLVDVFFDVDGVCLVMNYCSKGSVEDMIEEGKSIPPAVVLRVMLEGASGLRIVHECLMIHGDVKPSNMLFGENEVLQIADFGLAGSRDHAKFDGCKPYLAPEVKDASGGMSAASDMWALGCVGLSMLSGISLEQLYKKDGWALGLRTPDEITAWVTPKLQGVEEPLKSVLLALLNPDATKRMTAPVAITKLSFGRLYTTKMATNLSIVEAMKRRICLLFHDPERPPKANWERTVTYAGASHILLLDVMEDALKAQIQQHGWLRTLPDRSEVTVSPQVPKSKTAQGLVKAGNAMQKIFEAKIKELLAECKFSETLPNGTPRFLWGGVKSEARVRDKMMENDEQKSPEMAIFDINRGTMMCLNEAEFDTTHNAIKKVFGEPEKFKNKFKVNWKIMNEPPCLFYQVRLIPDDEALKELDDKRWVAEIQATMPTLQDLKDKLHPIYEVKRRKDKPLEKCIVCGNTSAQEGAPAVVVAVGDQAQPPVPLDLLSPVAGEEKKEPPVTPSPVPTPVAVTPSPQGAQPVVGPWTVRSSGPDGVTLFLVLESAHLAVELSSNSNAWFRFQDTEKKQYYCNPFRVFPQNFSVNPDDVAVVADAPPKHGEWTIKKTATGFTLAHEKMDSKVIQLSGASITYDGKPLPPVDEPEPAPAPAVAPAQPAPPVQLNGRSGLWRVYPAEGGLHLSHENSNLAVELRESSVCWLRFQDNDQKQHFCNPFRVFPQNFSSTASKTAAPTLNSKFGSWQFRSTNEGFTVVHEKAEDKVLQLGASSIVYGGKTLAAAVAGQ